MKLKNKNQQRTSRRDQLLALTKLKMAGTADAPLGNTKINLIQSVLHMWS